MYDKEKTGFVQTENFVIILNNLDKEFDEDELKNKINEVDDASEI